MEKQFYTYLWLREDGTPYYAGKGHGRRGFLSDGHRFNRPPNERIIVQDFETEKDAFFAEMFLIALYGRINNGTGCLRNLTNGGEGPAGMVVSEETRRRHSDAVKRRGPDSEETKVRKKAAAKLRGIAPELLARFIAMRKLRGLSTEQSLKMNAAKIGIHLSEEHKKKLSVLKKGKKFSEQHKKALSEARRKYVSPIDPKTGRFVKCQKTKS
jgi:hypothetical protein